jgi:hypothetical protein
MNSSTVDAPKHGSADDGRALRSSIYSPTLDFLLLGGGSLLILPLISLFPAAYGPQLLTFSFWLSFIINYPHFAHSYQIFYRDFPNKLRGRGYASHLRYRYAFAGIVVPLVIAAAFVGSYLSGSTQAMGACASAMTFFVGWHYVKQGYGIMIVDSVFHRGFFTEQEKKWFKFNAYCGWIFFFFLAAYQIKSKNLFGLQYYFVDVPIPLLVATGLLLAISSVLAVTAAVRAAKRTGKSKIPFNGYVTYITSIYIWLCTLFTPAVYYIIPAFHSLQYLAIVWKYEFNRERQRIVTAEPTPDADSLWVRYATFIGFGVLLGGAGFVVIPLALDIHFANDQSPFGNRLFAFMIFIFINIHHYFLDNVMWRKDNPDVSKHLFGAR